MAARPSPRPPRARALLVGAVVLAALAAYFGTLKHGFIYDDVSIVVENPHIRSLSYWPVLFATDFCNTDDPSSGLRGCGLYRPLTALTYSLDYAAHGLDPRGFHLANILLHAAVSVLLFLLLERLAFPSRAAWLSALAFAVLPIHAEAVSQAVGRAELLAALWSLCAWLLAHGESRPPRLAAAGLCYAAALLSKESAAPFPAALVLSELLARKGRLRELLERRLPVWAASLALLLLYLEWRSLILGGRPRVPWQFFAGDSPLTVWLTMARFLFTGYLWPALTGLSLHADYPRLAVPDAGPGDPGAWAALLAALGASAWSARALLKDRSPWGFSWLAFGVFLLPASNLIVRIEVVGAERLLYLPSAGLCALLGLALSRAASQKGRWRPLGLAAAAACLGWWGARAFSRSLMWRSDADFWPRLVEEAPLSARAWTGLGMLRDKQGRHAEALAAHEKALELDPRMASALYHLALARFNSGDFAEARRLAQGYLERFEEDRDVLCLLALVHEKQGRPRDALSAYRRAIEINPLYATARRDLGLLLCRLGRVEEGKEELLRYLELAPDGEDTSDVRRYLAGLGASAADCRPAFPYKDGWLGGDAAYSVVLPDGRRLWLFGDTFIGAPDSKDRAGSRMVANSLGLSECRSGRWSMSYRWRKGKDAPRAVFETGEEGVKYWPLDAFVHQGRLYAALSRIVETPGRGLGFEAAGVDLVRVDSPKGDPSAWKPAYRPLYSGKAAYPGASIALRGGHAYLFTPLEGPAYKRHPLTLTRLPLERLDEPLGALEYLARDGTWKRGLVPEDARLLAEEAATELSVRRPPGGEGWLMVHTHPGFPSREAVSRRAPALEGPWSGPERLFVYPETKGREKGVFCYAAKQQEGLPARPGSILLTYACNAFDFGRLVRDMDLYRPKAVEALR